MLMARKQQTKLENKASFALMWSGKTLQLTFRIKKRLLARHYVMSCIFNTPLSIIKAFADTIHHSSAKTECVILLFPLDQDSFIRAFAQSA